MSSNFWADKLRESGASPAEVAFFAPLPARETWWRSDLYTRDHRPPQAPPPPPDRYPATGGAYTSTKAQHTRDVGNCPSCGSSDYFRASPNTVRTCYTCGYPIQHSTSGAMVPNTSAGTAKAALGQRAGAGFQPQTIIGRI